MKNPLFVFAFLGASFALSAQTPAQPVVAVTKPASPVVVRWAEGAAGASSVVQNGMKIESLRSGSILIKVSPLTQVGDRYTQTWVGILNSGPDQLSFEPGKTSVEVIKPKARTFSAIPRETASGKIQNSGESKAQMLASTGQQGNLDCTRAQLMGGCQPPGSGVSTHAAQDQMLVSSQQSQWARQNGLSTASLEAGASVQGAVFFPREKEKEYVVRIPVGNYVFEFPFDAQDRR